MGFLGGPRQVGKTTLALGLNKSQKQFLITGSARLDNYHRGGDSLLSLNNLRQDLSVAHETTNKRITILENLYYCFRIMPYGLPHLRAIMKEKKLYLWAGILALLISQPKWIHRRQ